MPAVPESSYDYAEAQYYLGRIAVEEKFYDESVSRFEKAIHSNERNAEYHNWLGVMYGVLAMDANPLRQAYLAPKIKNEFERAAQIEPLNIPAQWGLINYYTKAPRFLGGSWEKAFACAKVIAGQNAAQGYRASGFVHTAQKKYAEAERELIKSTQLGPDDAENDYALAAFYAEQQKFEQALALYENLLKKDPHNMVAAFRLGHTTAQCGLYFQRGIACLNNYLSYNPKPNEPSHSGATADLAMIYEKMGDRPKAKAYYLSALKLEPGMKEAAKGLARVR